MPNIVSIYWRKAGDKVQFALLTDRGKIRVKNEDSVYARMVTENTVFFMVADGMGGHGYGDIASGIAYEIVNIQSEKSISAIINGEDPEKVLLSLVTEINNRIMEQCSLKREMTGMGTTLVIAAVCDGKLYISNVGDSRLYLYRKSQLTLLTVDHSVVQEMYDQGLISKEEADDHPQKNILTRAVGCDDIVDPDYFEYDVENDDILILCTDGLTNMVEDRIINDMLEQKKDLEVLCKELITLANQNGGSDNITCIVVRI